MNLLLPAATAAAAHDGRDGELLVGQPVVEPGTVPQRLTRRHSNQTSIKRLVSTCLKFSLQDFVFDVH